MGVVDRAEADDGVREIGTRGVADGERDAERAVSLAGRDGEGGSPAQARLVGLGLVPRESAVVPRLPVVVVAK
jgi:phage FluMu protein gp41